MSDKKLKLTVQESRHVFNSLQQSLLKVCEEELAEFHGPEHGSSPNQKDPQSRPFSDTGALWVAVENELRAAYEMSRFGMEIVDLNDDITNIDVFRGNCEDNAGIEPINSELLHKISMEMTEIQSLWGTNAIYRTKIPVEIEEHFQSYVELKRNFYDNITQSSNLPYLGETHPNVANLVNSVSPSTVEGALTELADRLTILNDQHRLLMTNNPTDQVPH